MQENKPTLNKVVPKDRHQRKCKKGKGRFRFSSLSFWYFYYTRRIKIHTEKMQHMNTYNHLTCKKKEETRLKDTI